jgi:hypothetical protein
MLTSVDAHCPIHGKYTSHSLRIGSHTEQVLLNVPLPVRLARFGWAAASEEMASLYFDRTLKTSPSSHWIFGTDARRSPVLPTSDAAARG